MYIRNAVYSFIFHIVNISLYSYIFLKNMYIVEDFKHIYIYIYIYTHIHMLMDKKFL